VRAHFLFAVLILSLLCAAAGRAPADVDNMTARQAYDAAFDLWVSGKQSDAEALLRAALARHQADQKLWFFSAACTRSRFDVPQSLQEMALVATIDPGTPEGRAAAAINALDLRQSVDENYEALRVEARDHRERPLLLWMLAVQCRALGRNVEGCTYFEALLASIKPGLGPVLLHQTYANLLDEAGRSRDAVPERELALRLEPAGWSYQGLGNTLTLLGNYEEAEPAFERAVALDPDCAEYWVGWARCLNNLLKHDAAIEKARRALELNPKSAPAWNVWGSSLEEKGDLAGAVQKYRTAIRIQPANAWAYGAAERALRRLGQANEADQLARDRERVASRGTGRRRP
jgi:tetratricopeptide (TPR) repeat protein